MSYSFQAQRLTKPVGLKKCPWSTHSSSMSHLKWLCLATVVYLDMKLWPESSSTLEFYIVRFKLCRTFGILYNTNSCHLWPSLDQFRLLADVMFLVLQSQRATKDGCFKSKDVFTFELFIADEVIVWHHIQTQWYRTFCNDRFCRECRESKYLVLRLSYSFIWQDFMKSLDIHVRTFKFEIQIQVIPWWVLQACKLTFSGYRLLPMGSFPKIADKRGSVELYGPVKKLYCPNYDRAMTSYLACLKVNWHVIPVRPLLWFNLFASLWSNLKSWGSQLHQAHLDLEKWTTPLLTQSDHSTVWLPETICKCSI